MYLSTSFFANLYFFADIEKVICHNDVLFLDVSEIDSLLGEGNMLLDKLMADNGLDLLPESVELADVDELITCEITLNSRLLKDNPVSDLFSQFYEPINEVCQQTPVSPVSTLPSEPASPVDLFSFEADISPEPAPTADNNTNNELEELLSSLLDEGNAPSNSSDYYGEQYIGSPANSSCSGSDYSSYDGSDYASSTLENSSTHSRSPAPEKVKPAKKKTSTPYSKLPASRKEKKKLQNKEAAIRYRQKKKSETQVLADEESVLQERNDALKAEVLNLEREIMCMKELLSDVFNIHSL